MAENPFDFFIAEVRDHDGDPWKSGRVKLRVYGRHDNEQDIKDDDLPWGMPLQNITSAATNRVGTSPTGMLTGSRVFGVYLDEAQQYPLILGTFARAGKLKDENDNTGGKDDIDEKHSDVPLAAQGKKKSNTQAKKTIEKQKEDPKKKSKYNKKDYVAQDDAEDPLDKSRNKYVKKTSDLKTIGSLDKGDNSTVQKKILNIDSGNESGALPQAPQMFQQLLQVSNMTGMGGLNGLSGIGMGGALSGIAGNFGIGNVLGMVGQSLGIDISAISGMTGMLGGLMGGMGSGSGGGGNGQGVGGGAPYNSVQTPANYVPLTPSQVGLTAAEILNQLKGFNTPSSVIGGMSTADRESLYTSLITLMNNVMPDLSIKITSTTFGTTYIPAAQEGNYIVTLPGKYVGTIDNVPAGAIQIFYFTDTDPYPGYMEWEQLDGQIIFCDRPSNRPYAATPQDDAINAGIIAIIDELLLLIAEGRLTIEDLLRLLGLLRDTTTAQATQNALGNNMNTPNAGGGGGGGGNAMSQLLGMMGQLVQLAEQSHLMESVLDNGKMQKTLQNYQQKGANLRKKKQLAKQAIMQKNENSGLDINNILGFQNMLNMNKSGGSGGNQSQPQQKPTQATQITKNGNTVVSIATIPYSNNTSNTGFYSTV